MIYTNEYKIKSKFAGNLAMAADNSESILVRIGFIFPKINKCKSLVIGYMKYTITNIRWGLNVFHE